MKAGDIIYLRLTPNDTTVIAHSEGEMIIMPPPSSFVFPSSQPLTSVDLVFAMYRLGVGGLLIIPTNYDVI